MAGAVASAQAAEQEVGTGWAVAGPDDAQVQVEEASDSASGEAVGEGNQSIQGAGHGRPGTDAEAAHVVGVPAGGPGSNRAAEPA